MIEKLDSKWLPLATASVLGQAPSETSGPHKFAQFMIFRAGTLNYTKPNENGHICEILGKNKQT